MVWHGMGWGLLPMLFVWLLWAAIIVAAVVIVLRFVGSSSHSTGGRGRSEAEEILKQRYARGELTKQQYDEMLEHIRR